MYLDYLLEQIYMSHVARKGSLNILLNQSFSAHAQAAFLVWLKFFLSILLMWDKENRLCRDCTECTGSPESSLFAYSFMSASAC